MDGESDGIAGSPELSSDHPAEGNDVDPMSLVEPMVSQGRLERSGSLQLGSSEASEAHIKFEALKARRRSLPVHIDPNLLRREGGPTSLTPDIEATLLQIFQTDNLGELRSTYNHWKMTSNLNILDHVLVTKVTAGKRAKVVEEYQQSILSRCISEGANECIEYLCNVMTSKHKAKETCRVMGEQRGAMIEALRFGNTGIVDLLFDSGFEATNGIDGETTALHYLAMQDKQLTSDQNQCFEILIKRCGIEAFNLRSGGLSEEMGERYTAEENPWFPSRLRTPLHWAVDNLHVQLVEVLLKFGADCEIQDHNGFPPFFTAVLARGLKTPVSKDNRKARKIVMSRLLHMDRAVGDMVTDHGRLLHILPMSPIVAEWNPENPDLKYILMEFLSEDKIKRPEWSPAHPDFLDYCSPAIEAGRSGLLNHYLEVCKATVIPDKVTDDLPLHLLAKGSSHMFVGENQEATANEYLETFNILENIDPSLVALDRKSSEGDTALHLVCKAPTASRRRMKGKETLAQKALAKLLLEKSGSLWKNLDKEGRTPVHLAFRNNLETLAKEVFLNRSPVEFAQMLLLGDSEGFNCMHHAIVSSTNKGWPGVELFVECAAIGKLSLVQLPKTKALDTPVILALKNGLTEVSKYLSGLVIAWNYGANKIGESPLMMAVRYEAIDVIERILSQMTKATPGEIPSVTADVQKSFLLALELCHEDIAEMILEEAEKLAPHRGESVLRVCGRNGLAKTARLLFSKDLFDAVLPRDNDYPSALDAAVLSPRCARLALRSSDYDFSTMTWAQVREVIDQTFSNIPHKVLRVYFSGEVMPIESNHLIRKDLPWIRAVKRSPFDSIYILNFLVARADDLFPLSATNEHIEVVNVLVDHWVDKLFNVTSIDQDKNTMSHKLAQRGYHEGLEKLLHCCAETLTNFQDVNLMLNSTNNERMTPLTIIGQDYRDESLFRVLPKWPQLTWNEGHAKCLEVLLNHSGTLTEETAGEALIQAIYGGWPEAVESLLRHGVGLLGKRLGELPLQVATHMHPSVPGILPLLLDVEDRVAQTNEEIEKSKKVALEGLLGHGDLKLRESIEEAKREGVREALAILMGLNDDDAPAQIAELDPNLTELVPVSRETTIGAPEELEVTMLPRAINERDSRGNTAISIAVENNDVEATRLLLNSGSDIRMEGMHGTLIHKVVEVCSLRKDTSMSSILSLLLENKTDRTLTDGAGRNILQYALHMKCVHCCETILMSNQQAEDGPWLPGLGIFDPTVENTVRKTISLTCQNKKFFPMGLQLLVDYAVPMGMPMDLICNGMPPLCHAVTGRNYAAVEVLIRATSQRKLSENFPVQQDIHNMNALMHAIRSLDENLVSLMVYGVMQDSNPNFNGSIVFKSMMELGQTIHHRMVRQKAWPKIDWDARFPRSGHTYLVEALKAQSIDPKLGVTIPLFIARRQYVDRAIRNGINAITEEGNHVAHMCVMDPVLWDILNIILEAPDIDLTHLHKKKRMSPLHLAIEMRNLEAANLIMHKARIKGYSSGIHIPCDLTGVMAIHDIVLHGDLNCIPFALEDKDLDLDIRDPRTGRTPFHEALVTGNVEMCRLILVKVLRSEVKMDVNMFCTQDDRYIIHDFVNLIHPEEDKISAVNILLGVMDQARERHKNALLHALDLFLQVPGLDLSFVDPNTGRVAFHEVVCRGDDEMTKMLLDHAYDRGLDVYANNGSLRNGRSAAHDLVSRGDIHNLTRIIQLPGIVLTATDFENKMTPMQESMAHGRPLLCYQMLQLAVESFVDVHINNVSKVDSRSLIHTLLRSPILEVVDTAIKCAKEPLSMLVEDEREVAAFELLTGLSGEEEYLKFRLRKALVTTIDIISNVRGVDFFPVDPATGLHPLHQAISNGDVDIALLMVHRHVERALPLPLNFQHGESGRTCLHDAVKSNFLALTRAIVVDTKSDLTLTDSINGWTPLMEAVGNRLDDMVILLVTAAEEVGKDLAVESVDNDGNTVAHLVARKNFTTLLPRFVPLDACQIHVRNREGLNPLMMAIGSGYNEFAVALIKSAVWHNKNLDINYIGPDGLTCLSQAAKNLMPDVVGAIVEVEGLDLMTVSADGKGALEKFMELVYGDPAVIDCLAALVNRIVELGLDINTNVRDEHGRVALWYAIELERPNLVSDLCLLDDIYLNDLDRTGITALHLALESVTGREGCLLALLKRAKERNIEVHCNKTMTEGSTVLHRLMVTNLTEELWLFLQEEQLEVNSRNERQLTPLHLAAAIDNVEMVRVLFENRRDVIYDVKDSGNRTPLTHALAFASTTQTAKYMLEKIIADHRRDVNLTDRDEAGKTAMFYALNRGDATIVGLLAQFNLNMVMKPVFDDVSTLHWALTREPRGDLIAEAFLEVVVNRCLQIDVNSQDVFGRTPIFYAIQRGYTRVVSLLCKIRGIDLDLIDVNEPSLNALALSIAEDDESGERTTALLDAVLNSKVSVNPNIVVETDDSGDTLLHACARHRLCTAISRLLQFPGISVNIVNASGLTPLHLAASEGHQDVIEVLMDAPNMDVNILGPLKQHPLLCALHRKYQNCSMTILEGLRRREERVSPEERCLDVNTVDDRGCTVAYYAVHAGYHDMLELLFRYNVDWSIFSWKDLLEESTLHDNVRTFEELTNAIFTDRQEINPIFDHYETKCLSVVGYAIVHNLPNTLEQILSFKGSKSIIESPDEHGRSSLLCAARLGHTRCVELLIEHEVNLYARSNTLDCVLHSVAETDDESGVEITKMVCAKAGVKEAGLIESKNGAARTPLHLAVANGKHALIDLLLSRGASQTAIDHAGKVPIYVSASTAVETQLLQHLVQRRLPATLRIDYCMNCEEHHGQNSELNHVSAKYVASVDEIVGVFNREFPDVRILLRPLIRPDGSRRKDISLGALEVFWSDEGRRVEALIFSKIAADLFPRRGHIVSALIKLLIQYESKVDQDNLYGRNLEALVACVVNTSRKGLTFLLRLAHYRIGPGPKLQPVLDKIHYRKNLLRCPNWIYAVTDFSQDEGSGTHTVVDESLIKEKESISAHSISMAKDNSHIKLQNNVENRISWFLRSQHDLGDGPAVSMVSRSLTQDDPSLVSTERSSRKKVSKKKIRPFSAGYVKALNRKYARTTPQAKRVDDAETPRNIKRPITTAAPARTGVRSLIELSGKRN